MTEDWAEIRAFYENLLLSLSYVEPMLHFVDEIAADQRFSRTYAFTSHEELVLSQHCSYPAALEMPQIRITPFKNGKVAMGIYQSDCDMRSTCLYPSLKDAVLETMKELNWL